MDAGGIGGRQVRGNAGRVAAPNGDQKLSQRQLLESQGFAMSEYWVAEGGETRALNQLYKGMRDDEKSYRPLGEVMRRYWWLASLGLEELHGDLTATVFVDDGVKTGTGKKALRGFSHRLFTLAFRLEKGLGTFPTTERAPIEADDLPIPATFGVAAREAGIASAAASGEPVTEAKPKRSHGGPKKQNFGD